MGMLSEFKEFAMRGNVIDLAVGVVIGAAFGKIVSSLVSDVIMPPIGWLIGNVDFSALEWVLQPASTAADGTSIAAVSIKYGLFLNAIIQFAIVAFAIFVVVKAINSLRKAEPPAPAAPPEPSAEAKLLAEIRDALKAR
ncbi:large-conductance mechanosensitive channel protein MscL [Silanimonas algicola]